MTTDHLKLKPPDFTIKVIPLVSTIVPCYNAAKWLDECLTSVCEQIYPRCEVFVIDDGSTDNSYEIARRYASTKVKVIRQENRGASAARNRGIEQAQGEYLQFLDADDLLSPDKIAAQIELLATVPPDLLSVSPMVFFRDGMPPRTGIAVAGGDETNEPVEWLTGLLGADGGMVQPGAWLTPRAVADKAGKWDETLTLDDDGEYFARVVLNSGGIRRANRGTAFYRLHTRGANLSARANRRAHRSALSAIDSKAAHLLARTQSEQAKRALAHSYTMCAMQAYPTARDVTREALLKADALGGSKMPSFGGNRAQLINCLLGWKAARWLSVTKAQMTELLNP